MENKLKKLLKELTKEELEESLKEFEIIVIELKKEIRRKSRHLDI